MKTFSLILYTRDLFFVLAGGLFVLFQQNILSITEGFLIALVLLVSIMIGVYLQYRRDQDIIIGVRRQADQDIKQRTEINRLQALFEDTYSVADQQRKLAERLAKEVEELKAELAQLKHASSNR